MCIGYYLEKTQWKYLYIIKFYIMRLIEIPISKNKDYATRDRYRFACSFLDVQKFYFRRMLFYWRILVLIITEES